MLVPTVSPPLFLPSAIESCLPLASSLTEETDTRTLVVLTDEHLVSVGFLSLSYSVHFNLFLSGAGEYEGLGALGRGFLPEIIPQQACFPC